MAIRRCLCVENWFYEYVKSSKSSWMLATIFLGTLERLSNLGISI